MSKPNRRTDTDPGWVNRRLRDLERKQREQAAAKRLQAATIGKGGITVKDGGGITIENGGGLAIKDNGAFTAEYPDGTESVRFGPAHTVDGRVTQALIVKDENGRTTFGATRTPYDAAFPAYPDGQRTVQAGSAAQAVDNFYVNAITSQFVNLPTTPAGANFVVDPSTGVLARSTSSLRYKQDVEAAAIDVDQVLGLAPRRFRRKDEVDEHGAAAPTYVGFIAEEAHELGLTDWVTSDEEGPESFSYATWAVALQAVARFQAGQLQQQAEQIADLTARLDALESSAEGA